MSTSTDRRTATTVPAVVCAVAGLWLVVANTAAGWEGPARAVAYVVGGTLLWTAATWVLAKDLRRLPFYTALLGVVLVIAPLAYFYRNEPTGPGISQLLTGLVVLVTGVLAGRALGAPRIDQL